MESLKIQIPKGFQIDSFNEQTGEIKFKELPKGKVTERIKTLADAINAIGENDEDVVSYRKLQSILGPDNHLINYNALVVIAKALNEGWRPDWNNDKYDKYYPWFYLDGGSSGFRFGDYVRWAARSFVGSRLCFKSSELAEYAAKQFLSVYKNFMSL